MNSVLTRVGSTVAEVLERPWVFDLQQRCCSSDYQGLKETFRPWLSGRRSVLDVGCGTGACAAALVSFEDVEYLGVDLRPQYIAYARQRYGQERFLCVDVGREPLPTQAFDAVLMFSILHHLSDEECRRLIGRLGALLGPGGVILSAEPLIPDPREYRGAAKMRALASRALLRMDRGEYIRDRQGYLELWERFERAGDYAFRNSLHDFCGFVLKGKEGHR